MRLLTLGIVGVLCIAMVNLATAQGKPAHTYQKGTITGYEQRLLNKNRKTRVYELKGTDHIYQVDRCGAFQAGKFEAGQSVDYRVSGDRLYILHDGDKEYGCKIEGEKAIEGTTTGESTPK